MPFSGHYKYNNSSKFKVTHQAPSSVIACYVLALTRVFLFSGQTDGRTDTIREIMTTYLAIRAWWVNNSVKFKVIHPPDPVLGSFIARSCFR